MDSKENLIGRVFATEKCPTSIDGFMFWTDRNLILNPFDVVKVSHVNGSFSYGIVEDISHITDAQSVLTPYISSDFGDLNSEDRTMRVGMNYVSAKVILNDKGIYIPLQNGARVMLASKKEIIDALGLGNMKSPLVCGYVEMYKKSDGDKDMLQIPVYFNSKYLIGMEGAHLNISGISGMAAKTSYAMFLLKAIQDGQKNMANEDGTAFVLFNVKDRDLLAIDAENDFSDEGNNAAKAKQETHETYKTLGLPPAPFSNVTYYYPGFIDGGKRNTYMEKKDVDAAMAKGNAKVFKYVYADDKNSLDFLFANIDDTTQTMEAILNYVAEGGSFDRVESWKQFTETAKTRTEKGGNPDKEITIASWRKFSRIINNTLKENPLFAEGIDCLNHEVRLEDAIKHIRGGEVHVIDIAALNDIEQAFVFGSTMRNIYDLKQHSYDDKDGVKPPKRIIVFIDELNKYASNDVPKNSPILRQVIEMAERGRSLGVVLFAAEQFRSVIHSRVKGNCSTHAYGRTTGVETSSSDYKSIPNVYKGV